MDDSIKLKMFQPFFEEKFLFSASTIYSVVTGFKSRMTHTCLEVYKLSAVMDDVRKNVKKV